MYLQIGLIRLHFHQGSPKELQLLIETGILTPKHRDEIVTSVAHIMLSYTIKPSGTEYHTICRRLIQQYPTLKDDKSETGYVSFVCMYCYTHTDTHVYYVCLFLQGIWKKKLNNKFKNWRRPDRNKRLDSFSQDGDDALSLKRVKIQCVSKTSLIEPSSSEKSAHEQHIKYLQKCYSTCKYSSTTITTIMEETAP